MIFESGHPDVDIQDWNKFAARCGSGWPISSIDKLIDRKHTSLPEDFFPLARGAALASGCLLRQAGYCFGIPKPPGWFAVSPYVYKSDGNIMIPERELVVRECGGLWTIERWRQARTWQAVDQLLVHKFGSTPILASSATAAMHVAVHCDANYVPGLGWTEARPQNWEAAVDRARQRTA
jgi:hypothetical protein